MENKELSKEEKTKRISNLQQLRNSEGWKILKQEIQDDIALIDEKLHGLSEKREGETDDFLRSQWIDRTELSNLPENLIREYTDEEGSEPSEFSDSLDPYNQTKEETKE